MLGAILVMTLGDDHGGQVPEAGATATTDISARESSDDVSRSTDQRDIVSQSLTDAVAEQRSHAAATRANAATTRADAEAAREGVEDDIAQKEAEREAARRAAEEEAAREAAEEAIEEAIADPHDVARAMLADHGWGEDQFQCLDDLWARESNWDHTATNPTSGAYGIPQALPPGKMSSAGDDWETNPKTQIEWGLGYIDESYGTPCSAWAHSESHNWY